MTSRLSWVPLPGTPLLGRSVENCSACRQHKRTSTPSTGADRDGGEGEGRGELAVGRGGSTGCPRAAMWGGVSRSGGSSDAGSVRYPRLAPAPAGRLANTRSTYVFASKRTVSRANKCMLNSSELNADVLWQDIVERGCLPCAPGIRQKKDCTDLR